MHFCGQRVFPLVASDSTTQTRCHRFLSASPSLGARGAVSPALLLRRIAPSLAATASPLRHLPLPRMAQSHPRHYVDATPPSVRTHIYIMMSYMKHDSDARELIITQKPKLKIDDSFVIPKQIATFRAAT